MMHLLADLAKIGIIVLTAAIFLVGYVGHLRRPLR